MWIPTDDCCVCYMWSIHSHIILCSSSNSDISSLMLKPSLVTDYNSIDFWLSYKLLQQYDIISLTKPLEVFKNMFFSRHSVEQRHDCRRTDTCVNFNFIPRLVICKKWGKLSSLQRKNLQKFAVANGNYFGQQTAALQLDRRDLKRTACLLWPVRSYGRLVKFHGQWNALLGSRLTGYKCSNKLDTTFARKKLPIKSKESPLKVVVVSSFAKNDLQHEMRHCDNKRRPFYWIGQISWGFIMSNKAHNTEMSSVEVENNVLGWLLSGDVSKDKC